jgi:hypothetical protein
MSKSIFLFFFYFFLNLNKGKEEIWNGIGWDGMGWECVFFVFFLREKREGGGWTF